MLHRRQVDPPDVAVDPIIGGNPAERCRSEALFLTAKARSSVMSIYNPLDGGDLDLL